MDPEEKNNQEEAATTEGTSPMPNPLRERMMKSRPDGKYDTDEDMQNSIIEYMDELEGYKGSSEAANQKLIEVMDANPELVDMIRDLANGATPAEAIARNFDLDELTPKEGEPDYESWAKNKEMRLAKKSEMEARNKEYQDNLSASEANVREFAAENNMSEEEAGKMLEEIESLFADIVAGKISKEFIAKMRKALTADQEKQEAVEMAKIEGKNEAIVAKKVPVGDGIPKTTGGAIEAKQEAASKPDIFDRVAGRQKTS